MRCAGETSPVTPGLPPVPETETVDPLVELRQRVRQLFNGRNYDEAVWIMREERVSEEGPLIISDELFDELVHAEALRLFRESAPRVVEPEDGAEGEEEVLRHSGLDLLRAAYNEPDGLRVASAAIVQELFIDGAYERAAFLLRETHNSAGIESVVREELNRLYDGIEAARPEGEDVEIDEGTARVLRVGYENVISLLSAVYPNIVIPDAEDRGEDFSWSQFLRNLEGIPAPFIQNMADSYGQEVMPFGWCDSDQYYRFLFHRICDRGNSIPLPPGVMYNIDDHCESGTETTLALRQAASHSTSRCMMALRSTTDILGEREIEGVRVTNGYRLTNFSAYRTSFWVLTGLTIASAIFMGVSMGMAWYHMGLRDTYLPTHEPDQHRLGLEHENSRETWAHTADAMIGVTVGLGAAALSVIIAERVLRSRQERMLQVSFAGYGLSLAVPF